MSFRPPSILAQSHPSPCVVLTTLQAQVDGLVGGFAAQATDWRSLTSMTLGGMAYRLGRIGTISVRIQNFETLQRIASVGIGLGAEITAFEMTNRTLAQITGEGSQYSNRWRWNGTGGIRQGLLQSFITFGTLKGAGRIASRENLVVQHLLQDSAMVLGHNISGALDPTLKPTGALAEQLLHAEATNLQIGAGMALTSRFSPGMQAWEKGLDLTFRPPSAGERENSFLSLRLATSSGINHGRAAEKGDPSPLFPNLILMSSKKRRRDWERSEPPVISDMRPKGLSNEEAASGTFSYPPANESLLEVEARYQMVVESATDGIITVGEDGRILSVNPAMQRIFGYESGELLGKSLTLLMPPGEVSRHEIAFDRYLATGEQTFSWESIPLTGWHKDGRNISLEVSYSDFIRDGRRTFTAVMRDVSERRKAEQALQEITDRNEALLRAMPYKLARIRRDGTILDVRSNQPEDLLESPEKLIGSNVRDLPLPQALKEIITITLPKAFETGEMQIVDYLFTHPDGRNLVQRARILKSGPDEVVWITEDITENKREEAIRLERERHETLLLIGRGLAHDIKNALGGGLPLLHLMKDSLEDLLAGSLSEADALRNSLKIFLEDVMTVEEQMNRIRGMTAEFSELTDTPKLRQPLDLHSFVQKRNLRAHLGPGIGLTLQMEPAPFRVWGNLDDLTRVIENLVTNARDAMEGCPHPILTVETRGINLNAEALARLLPMPETGVNTGRFMRLRVRDTGQGMDESTLGRIFEPYFSTKTQSSSHRGIGLAISRKLIRDMEGFITVKSKLGEGTVFDLYLPEAAEVREAALIRDPFSKAHSTYPPPTLPPPSSPPPER
jgi:PAS domain S-box-containing protein